MEIALARLNAIDNDGHLDVSKLGLRSLDWMIDHPNFNKIRAIDCSENYLTSVPLFTSIHFIDCSYNSIIVLPCWLTVETVLCMYNFITELPCWPIVCSVSCYGNYITRTPLWPEIRSIALYKYQVYNSGSSIIMHFDMNFHSDIDEIEEIEEALEWNGEVKSE